VLYETWVAGPERTVSRMSDEPVRTEWARGHVARHRTRAGEAASSMADEHELDPFERYFRPGGPIETGGPAGPGPVADAGPDERSEGVMVGDVPAPRVPVGGHRRPDGRGQGTDPHR